MRAPGGGICRNNAVAKSFFKLKNGTAQRGETQEQEKTRKDVFEYIKWWCKHTW
jgi:hypothetical protein